MMINTKNIMSISEANQNFSKATRLAEETGEAIIFKNNRPKFLLLDLDSNPQIEMSNDEKIDFVAKRILCEHRQAFLELAK